MIFWLYNVLIILLSPIWVIWMIWRAKKRKEQPDWKQRTGDLPLSAPTGDERRVWIHAVSVGEVMAAIPVLKHVRSLDPGLKIVLSTTTSSGQTAAKERAKGLFDHLIYFPIDVPRFVIAAMIRVRPKVVAVMETELWMNFLWAAKQFGSQTMVINGRVSQRSFSRSLGVRPYYRALFENLDQALVQSETDALRYKALGFAEPQAVGNTKFDAAVEDVQQSRDWRDELEIPPDVFLVVIGSTRSELEETLVIEALASLPKAWVVHAPRHIERAPVLAGAYKTAFGSAALRSKGEKGQRLVLDTFGELAEIYAAADVVVVGGGFDNLGGQNIIQPMAHGKPVIYGPNMQNFKDIAEEACLSNASIVVPNSAELANALKQLAESKELRQQMGAASQRLVEANLGASQKCAEAIVASARN